jgi:hypothetical protein
MGMISKVLPIAVHGDAIAGQGICCIVQMAQLIKQVEQFILLLITKLVLQLTI